MSYEDRLDKLKDIKTENYIWLIYIGIIVLSFYANSKEKEYILYNDFKSKKEYQNLLITIFSILLVIYYYFAKNGYDDLINLDENETDKKKFLTLLSFIGSALILISGIIFLGIAIVDDNICIFVNDVKQNL